MSRYTEEIEVTLHDLEVEVDYHDLNEQDIVAFVVEEHPELVLEELAKRDKMVDTDDARAAVMEASKQLERARAMLVLLGSEMHRLKDALGIDP